MSCVFARRERRAILVLRSLRSKVNNALAFHVANEWTAREAVKQESKGDKLEELKRPLNVVRNSKVSSNFSHPCSNTITINTK